MGLAENNYGPHEGFLIVYSESGVMCACDHERLIGYQKCNSSQKQHMMPPQSSEKGF